MHSDVLSAAVAGKSPSFDQALSVMVDLTRSRKDSSELLAWYRYVLIQCITVPFSQCADTEPFS